MKNRKQRVELLVHLIKTQNISSQEQLSRLLAEKGFKVTQATLSRDLKLLKTSKVPTEMGEYAYRLPDANTMKDQMLMSGRPHPALKNQGIGFISLEFSGNMAVVKTRNGYASGVAYDIDMLGSQLLIGSVAGANTILIVIREGVSHEEVYDLLARILPLAQRSEHFSELNTIGPSSDFSHVL